jgi:2-phosphosulfolactate phosphatase
MSKLKVEVCLSPALFDFQKNTEAIVVVVDILRATSSICNAFANGVDKIMPVETRNIALEMKNKGFTVAAERNGYKLDFADFGNSPFNFSRENVEGKTIVYSTTNGTRTIHQAADCFQVIIASFLNNKAVANYLIEQNRDVIIFCAGWKNKFNIEDTVYSGCLVESLLESGLFETNCDSAFTAVDMWKHWKNNLRELIDKSAQRFRLQEKGLDDCIDFCLQLDETDIVPVFKNDVIVSHLNL